MSLLIRFILPIFFLISVLQLPAFAQEEDKKTLRVAIKPSEPWVMYDTKLPDDKKQPIGFSIDLWRGIAKEIGVKTQWVYTDNVKKLLEAVQEGRADAGIAAITIRSDREKVIDFSTSMYELGLQIMVREETGIGSPFTVLTEEVGQFLTLDNLLIFLLALFCVTNLRWWADKWTDDEHRMFSQRYWLGVYEAFWWSLTMLLTWEAPKNRGLARLIDLSWHLIGLIALSVLTGVIAAALTIQAVGGVITSEKDLPDRRVAAVATDAPRDYLNKIGARVVPVESLNEGIQKLLDKEVEALVHDGPRLLYLAKLINRKRKLESKQGVLVIPAVFNQQNYGIVLPNGSPYLERANLALLKLREPVDLEDSFHEELKKKWIPDSNQ